MAEFGGKIMEWATLQHLDLRHVGRSAKPFQPHAATFHPTQAIVATAVGTYITGTPISFQWQWWCTSILSPLLGWHLWIICLIAEFDVYTGSKIASINIGSPVVRMAYSPTSGHSVIAILEVSFGSWKLLQIPHCKDLISFWKLLLFRCNIWW